MTARIYSGLLVHERLSPLPHTFKNRVGFIQVDLEELAVLAKNVKGFSLNTFAPVSVNTDSYLRPGPGSLREKLQPWIDALKLPEEPDSVSLVTNPHWWGKAFNPVCFYLLRNSECKLIALIAEVNNTFGDRHIYPVPLNNTKGLEQGENTKEFHVSPFNDMEGSYRFSVREHDDELTIGVDLYKEGKPFLLAWIEGLGKPLNTSTLWKHYLRHPLQPWLTMPRIIWQAVMLKYRRKLNVFKRPDPKHPDTILHRHRPAD